MRNPPRLSEPVHHPASSCIIPGTLHWEGSGAGSQVHVYRLYFSALSSLFCYFSLTKSLSAEKPEGRRHEWQDSRTRIAICAPKHSQVHMSNSVSHCRETTDLRKPRRCSKSVLLKHKWALGILFECGPPTQEVWGGT